MPAAGQEQSEKRSRGIWGAPNRAFIRTMQSALLQHALSHWPRRDAPLLEVNCGNGAFLPLLWQSGFDVRAVEEDSGLRQAAQARKIAGLEFYAAREDDLPFEEDAFDWVILHLRDSSTYKKAILEAVRVAKRGVMASFWNSISLASLLERLHLQKLAITEKTFSWFKVWSHIRNLHTGRITSFSVLAGPVLTWSSRCPLASCNAILSGLPLGSWCIIKVDFGAFIPFTPLPLRFGKHLRETAPAMEFVQKNQIEKNEDI